MERAIHIQRERESARARERERASEREREYSAVQADKLRGRGQYHLLGQDLLLLLHAHLKPSPYSVVQADKLSAGGHCG